MIRFVFDTSVLIGYIRDENSVEANAILKASEVGNCYVPIICFMELCKPNKSRQEVKQEIKKIIKLIQKLNMRVVCVSCNAQKEAVRVIEQYYQPLGNNSIPDSLILSSGIKLKAWIVTGESRRKSKWFEIYRRTITPEELLQRF